MKFVYVILIFISLVSTELETLNIVNNENSDVNLNNLVDRSIPQISQFIIDRHLDPLNLPQTEKKLWMELSNITVSNEIKPMMYKADLILHSGILKYLSNLKRYGNATLSYKDKVLKLDISFEFVLLQGTYNFIIKLVFFNLKGQILVSAASVRAKIIIAFNTMNYTLSLEKLELQVPGSIKVILDKNGLIDWINTYIIKIIIPFFKNTIVNVVQKETAKTIGTYFNEINQIIAKKAN